MSNGFISVSVKVSDYVDVDVDIDDIIASASPEDLAKLRGAVNAPGTGDPTTDRFAEAAYLVAKDMPDCPQAFRDLLWHVHGRAI